MRTAPPQDRLARMLQSLRMRSTFCCHAELTKPWALEMPAIPDTVSFHMVTSGLCFLQLPEVEPMELRAGDLALVPHGLGHELGSGGMAVTVQPPNSSVESSPSMSPPPVSSYAASPPACSSAEAEPQRPPRSVTPCA